MTPLEEIQHRHTEELSSLNRLIQSRLESSNPLMTEIVSSQLRTRGKQLRPLLVILCAAMFGPVSDKVMNAAAAVELLHNASLIHDDVVDNSGVRRGNPTINAVWHNHVAVLVGDYFTSSAMQLAIETGEIAIVDSLCALGRRLSLGEIEQIFRARNHNASVDAYYQIIDYKTASLFVSSAQMGCIAAGAPVAAQEALSHYAAALGRCFQIRDDIFDYFPSTLVGKPTGNDLREGKVSLPLLLALEKNSDPEIKALLQSDSLSDSTIARIQAFARDNGGIAGAYGVMKELRDRGVEALQSLPESDIRQELTGLIDFIIERNF